MSTDGEENNQSARPRRASFVELFASRPTIDSSTAQTNTARPHAASMAAAVTQQAQQQSRTRRLSITTLGLSASPPTNQMAVPFGSLKRGSVSAATGRRGSVDMSESAVTDEEPGPLTSPGAPTGRRLSFGAKAYRDLKTTGGTSAISEASTAAISGSKLSSPSSSAKGTDGFNWSDNLRAKAKRSSVSAATGTSSGPAVLSPMHNRTSSTASSQSSISPPAPKPLQKAPDHFQERILKGDFYMD